MAALVIPLDSALHAVFSETLAAADIVFFAGLPGVGKSLLLQQMALMAAAGRGAADRRALHGGLPVR